MGSSRTAKAMLLLAVVVPGGCGATETSVAVAPSECLESWNAESTSQTFGRHVYDTHESHQAQVALLQPADPNPNVDRSGECAVIFAVPEWDLEYGAVGLVMTDFGWASMQELARDDQAALNQIQGTASESVNATLFPDGKLEPN
jgi:hypothetical protein